MIDPLINSGSGQHPFSMRIRLTLWITLIITVVLWVTSLIFWLYVRQSMSELSQRSHGQMSSSIAREIEPSLPGMTREMLDQFEDQAMRPVEFESVFLDVYAVNGRSVVSGDDAFVPGELLPLEEAAGTVEPTVLYDGSVLSLINKKDTFSGFNVANLISMVGRDGQPYVLLFATSNLFAERQISLVSRLIQVVYVISPLIGLVSGWFISGIAVAPILRARELIQQMNPEMLQGAVRVHAHAETSEVENLAQDVDAARTRIRTAFEAQERFLANVSHEIKTPIAVMLVESQTLDVDGLPEHVVNFAESVQDEMNRLGNLVESFLTLTRLQDGHDRSSGKRISVNEIVVDSVEHCTSMARQQGVRLLPHLLDSEEQMDTAITGEPELLVTMLDNLIRNAIRFSKPDDVISINIDQEGDEVVLTVRDHGPGIPEDRIDRIFDRFSQGGNERRGRGHGLGLSIAQGIAEMHRGTISVRNADPGCIFCIRLPVHWE